MRSPVSDTALTPGVGESCSSPVQPAHPWADPHCLVPASDGSDAGALETARADAAVKENFTRAGPAPQLGMRFAFSFFFFFPFSSLYVTNAEEEEETERKYSLETQRSHRTVSGCQTALSWGRGGSCQQPPGQMRVPGRLDSAPTAGPSVGSTRTAEPGASRPPFSGAR